MSEARARIIGINRLIKRMNLIPDAVFDEAAEVITEQTGEIATEAAEIAPKESGDLAKKIKARKTRKMKTKVTATVYSGSAHSINLEYGTALQPAQPFLRPAAKKRQRLEYMSRRILEAFRKTQGG